MPGTYWYIVSCSGSCASLPVGPGPQPHGCCKHGKAFWVVDKLREYWAYARRTPQVVGFNGWHWEDVPSLQPPTFSRGAKTLGPDLWQWIRWVGFNITTKRGTLPVCSTVLSQLCGGTRHASAGNCVVCAGLDQKELETAKCNNSAIEAWCSSPSRKLLDQSAVYGRA